MVNRYGTKFLKSLLVLISALFFLSQLDFPQQFLTAQTETNCYLVGLDTARTFSGPSRNYEMRDQIQRNQRLDDIQAQAPSEEDEEAIWWQLSDGSWVHERYVVDVGDCEDLPIVDPTETEGISQEDDIGCELTPLSTTALYEGPGYEFEEIARFELNTSALGVAQAMSEEGRVWWLLPEGTWVDSLYVREYGPCEALPLGWEDSKLDTSSVLIMPTAQAEADVFACALYAVGPTRTYAGPGRQFDEIGRLSLSEEVEGVAQAPSLEDEGRVWWQLNDGSWVDSLYVNEVGSCDDLPTVNPSDGEVVDAPTTTADTPNETETCEVTANSATRVFAGPGRDFEHVGELPAGETALAIGQSEEGRVWWQLNDGNWVDSFYVSESESCEELPTGFQDIVPATLPDAITCNLKALNSIQTYAGPGDNFSVVGQLQFRDEVNAVALAQLDERYWWQLADGSWVDSYYVMETGDCEALPLGWSDGSVENNPDSETANLPDCNLEPRSSTRLFAGPGRDFEQTGQLLTSASVTGVAQAIGDGDRAWWQLADGSWVDSFYVHEIGDCDDLPFGLPDEGAFANMDLEVLLERAELAATNEAWLLVIESYQSALELDPENAELYINLGLAYRQIGDYASALDNYNLALDVDPNLALAYAYRAQAYMVLSNNNQARTDIDQALALDSNLAEAYFVRGQLWLVAGDTDRAFEDFNRVIRANSSYADAYFERARIHEQRGNVDAAVDDYDRAGELYEIQRPSYAGVAYGRATQVDPEQAVRRWSSEIRLNPTDATAYARRAFAYDALGDYESALQDYNRSLELDPTNANTYANRGGTYDTIGEYDLAIADYSRAIDLDPTDAITYNNRGFTYDTIGEFDLAIADYSQAIAIDPLLAIAYANRAYSYNQIGEQQLALTDFSRAIELDPTDVFAYFDRGIIYYDRGDYERAIADFDRVVELAPQNANIYAWRGYANLISGYAEFDSVREDFCMHVQLAGDEAASLILDELKANNWTCR